MAKKRKRTIIKQRARLVRRSRSKNKKRKPIIASKSRRYDPRLEAALKHMREGDGLSKAARKVGATPAQLRSYALATGTVERRSGKWHFKRDRRFRRMPVYADGKRVVITVHNSKSASLIGKYMHAVRQFFETENVELLAPFHNRSVPDITGKRYIFETRPNVLFRLDASGVEPFELVYAIVKQD